MNGIERQSVAGVAFAATAFTIWGIAPLYFKLLAGVAPTEIVAHRIVWTALMLFAILLVTRRLRHLAPLWQDRRVLARVALACLFISVNWLVFIWSVTHDRVLATSLGYFINPLVSVLLGVVFLGERLRPAQKAAVAIAAIAIALQVVQHGRLPWISLVLAASFGMYGFMKKHIELDAMNGLFAETLMMSPFALAFATWLTLRGDAAFLSGGVANDLLLATTGIITLVPLTCFGAGARRINLSTVGFIQYLAPSFQFILAVFVFAEPFGLPQLATFVLIWISIAVYSVDGVRASRERRRARLRPVEEPT